jgi:SAM-dependent methyltransferase
MVFTHRLSAYNRNRKWITFQKVIKPSPSNTILDVGFSDREYSPVDNYLEKHYPHLDKITALGIDEPKEFLIRYPKVKVIQYAGSEFPFTDKEFDICWSNAVIEHVGDQEKQVLFLKEVKRVSKIAFISTPNKSFPIELHTRTPFLHFLPKQTFDKYLKMVGKSWATGDYMNLLTKNHLRSLIHRAGIEDHKIISNKLLGFTLDFVIIF